MIRRLAPLAVCASVVACGPEFYEPQPAVVVQTERSVRPTLRYEPTVVQFIFDVYVADTSACEDAVNQLGDALEIAIDTDAPAVQFLPLSTVTPFCRTSPQAPTLSADAVISKLEWAAKSYPDAAAQPLVVYVNNLSSPLAPNVADALEKIHAAKVGPAQLHPLLWGITQPVARTINFDQTIDWTFAGDTALNDQLAQLGKQELPAWSVVGAQVPTELLTQAERDSVLAVKQCSADPGVVTDLPPDGAAASLMSVRASAYLSLPEQLAQPRSSALPREGTVRLELCTSNCDRHLTSSSDALGPAWLGSPGCQTLQATEVSP